MSRYAVGRVPPIHRLAIAAQFDVLTEQEKLYAHHAARAAWHGSGIILQQVSPESTGIYRFILALYQNCQGRWQEYVDDGLVSQNDLDHMLNYAATFLSNIGNFYGSGDSKFVPALSKESLRHMVSRSKDLNVLLEDVVEDMYSVPPYSLGYPGKATTSSYYPGAENMSVQEITLVSRELQKRMIYPENTRIRKTTANGTVTFEVMQASVDTSEAKEIQLPHSSAKLRIATGDHSEALHKVCESWSRAAEYASNDLQRKYIAQYIESFKVGDLETYRSALKDWIKNRSPKVEDIFGFVEPYRDPYGIRAEFEGLVAINDAETTKLMHRLVKESDFFIRQLPWVTSSEDEGTDGNGPFEKNLFDPPDFTSINALAYCSSIVFGGINLPNYNDIRQDSGFKNVIINNRMEAESSPNLPCPYIDDSEVDRYNKHRYAAYYAWVVLHELFGHGTGRLLVESSDNQFNFDIHSPPIDPLTGSAITSWYKPGETWTSQFEDLATTVDECRAELVGAYLLDSRPLLELFGFTDETEIKADEVIYNLYQQQGTDGLRALADFNNNSGRWGQAHARAHFAIMKYLLREGRGVLEIECDRAAQRLTVHVDRSKIIPHGKEALGRMLLRLHIYRSTADITACREFYEDLSRVDGEFLEWHNIVSANPRPKWVYVQANTFLDGKHVTIKEYPATPAGVVQSWAERNV